MARVLVVVPNVPHPLVSGGHLRDWQIVNLLARAGVRPSLLYFGAGEPYALGPGDPITPLCADVVYGGARVEQPDATPWDTLRRKLSYLVGTAGAAHPFAYQYDAMGAGEVILRTAERVGAEIVVLRGFWCHHAPRLRAAGLRVVANCPDANVRLARAMVRSRRTPLGKLGPLCNWAGVWREERRALALCDEVWAPTPDEAAEIAALARPPRLLTLPNLIDVDAYPDLTTEPGEPDTLLFVANFAYAPNHDAAEALLTRILPAIRARRPAARLLLVGRGLDAALAALAARLPGVETPGFVGDVRPWYRRASLVLLPVRDGAGTLFKALEALACGRATVGAPEAFRGLPATDPAPFVAAATWQDLAARTVELCGAGERRRDLAARARRFARERLSWSVGLRCLETSLVVGG
jgi:glycosyltransferase involved in cell wall biosynthesis